MAASIGTVDGGGEPSYGDAGGGSSSSSDDFSDGGAPVSVQSTTVSATGGSTAREEAEAPGTAQTEARSFALSPWMPGVLPGYPWMHTVLLLRSAR